MLLTKTNMLSAYSTDTEAFLLLSKQAESQVIYTDIDPDAILLNTNCKQDQQIDISMLAAGCYQVEIIDETNTHFYKKIIKTSSL